MATLGPLTAHGTLPEPGLPAALTRLGLASTGLLQEAGVGQGLQGRPSRLPFWAPPGSPLMPPLLGALGVSPFHVPPSSSHRAAD